MKYAVIGDRPAPTYFTVDGNTGRLSVKANLKQSDAFTYKVWGHFTLHFDWLECFIGESIYLENVCDWRKWLTGESD